MSSLESLEKKLKEPFPEKIVHFRVGSMSKDKTKGIALAYIDARDVMKRLDQVVGFSNWSDSYEETPSGRLFCCLSIRIDGEWIDKVDGAGDTNVEGAKGGISDSFKRAAVKWGIGRYLYYLPTTWVTLNKFKQIENPPKLPSWALPTKSQPSVDMSSWS